VLGALSAATWLSYGIWLSDGPQLLANAPSVVGAAAIVALIVARTRHTPRWLVTLPVGWAAFAASAAVVDGVFGLGLAATGIGVYSRVPQVRSALASENLAGVSLASQWLALVSAGLWLMYGAGSHLAPVVLSSSCAILLILGVIVPTARAQRPTSAAVTA
jgi:uncharacterized protein with PQ loop repeat